MRALAFCLLLFVTASTAIASPSSAVTCAAADILKVPKHLRKYQRYLWKSSDETPLPTYKLVGNLLSKDKDFFEFCEVSPELLRVDIRDPQWERKVWERLRDKNFVFTEKTLLIDRVTIPVVRVQPPGGRRPPPRRRPPILPSAPAGSRPREAFTPGHWLPGAGMKTLVEECQSEAPIVFAEQWLSTVTRQESLRNVEEGTGYCDFLGLADRDAFFRLVGLDPKKAELDEVEWLGVFESGISQQERLVLVRGGTRGRTFTTLDVFNASGAGIAKENIDNREFNKGEADAEEHYGPGPSGLPVTFLNNGKGKRQATAPDKLGPDDSLFRVSKDSRIHNTYACWSCHSGDVLQSLDHEWVRLTYFRKGAKLKLNVKGGREQEKRIYRRYKNDLARIVQASRVEFQHAIRAATVTKGNPKGWSAQEATTQMLAATNRYNFRRVTSCIAARELGVSERHFLAVLDAELKAGDLKATLSVFLDDPQQTLSRLEWESAYSAAQALLFKHRLLRR